MAHHPCPTQGIVAFDIRLRLVGEFQGLRCIDGSNGGWFTVQQPVQQVEDISLPRRENRRPQGV